MTAASIIQELRALGNDRYKRVLLNHGATEPCLGVKIEHLKSIQKRVGQDYQLALDLYETGIYDAMYLAGLVADDGRMSKKDLQRWVEKSSRPLAGSMVPAVAAGSPHGWDLAREWIDSDQELVALAGWGILNCLVSVKPDSELDLAELERLLERVQQSIHSAPNDVRYQMNGFVISVGSYVKALTRKAVQAGERIGVVSVDMGNTACQVPFAPDYIRKVEQRGSLGRKRKHVKG